LKSTADRYGKKRKHVELFKEKLQEKVQTILQVGGGGEDARVISRAYTRTGTRRGASTITTIIA
jgi:hypothetical protein